MVYIFRAIFCIDNYLRNQADRRANRFCPARVRLVVSYFFIFVSIHIDTFTGDVARNILRPAIGLTRYRINDNASERTRRRRRRRRRGLIAFHQTPREKRRATP